MKTHYLCCPLSIKPTTTSSSMSSSATNNSRVVPPTASLLDRFREAVFRLIMTTALSKAVNNNSSSSSKNIKSCNNRNDYRNSSNFGQDSVRRSCYPHDPHHNEALADCIEFIKKSASLSPSDHFRLDDDHDIDDDDDEVDKDVESSRDSTASSGVIISLCST